MKLTGNVDNLRLRVVTHAGRELADIRQRRNDGNWHLTVGDFDVPAAGGGGDINIMIYVVTGRGDGASAFITNIRLRRLDPAREDQL